MSRELTIQDAIVELSALLKEHGNLPMQVEYYCGDCNDMHETSDVIFAVTMDNKVVLARR